MPVFHSTLRAAGASKPFPGTLPPMPAAPRTYTGVLHVHTDRSAGAGGTLEEVLTAARANAIDFVILTDHGTLGHALENNEGWHDGVLIICGEEVVTDGGHLLAFETRETIGEHATLESAIAEVRRQVGVSVSIHHALPPTITTPLDPAQADLLEIWSFMDDFLSRTSPRDILHTAARPDKVLAGPSRSLLRHWDRLLQQQQLPIIGGLNVHQHKQPLLEWKLLFPYSVAFQTICTCVQTAELPPVAMRARDMVWKALREGRSYVVNRAVGPEKGFLFEYVSEAGRTRHMGEDAPYNAGGKFRIMLPQAAEVVLRHNGQPLSWSTASHMTFPTAGPGSYRVEAYLNRRLWLLSNAIRLTDDDRAIQPTVSDIT